MLDTLLYNLTRIGWVLFSIYVVVIFVHSLVTQGVKKTFLILFTWRVFLPLLLVLSLSTLSISLVFVKPTNVGVVISLASQNGVRNKPFNAGLHFIIPFVEKTLIYPIYWQTYTMSSKPMEGDQPGEDAIRARTKDGQEVLIDCSVIFRIDPEQAVRVHIEWQERYIKDFVRPLIRGMVRRQVSQFTVDEVNSESRTKLESTLDQDLKEEFDNKGLILDQFLLRDITFTPEYAASIEHKQIAEEGQTQKEYEAEQLRRFAEGERDALKIRAEGEREALIIRAQGRAEAIKIEADAQAAAFEAIGEALKVNSQLLTHEYIQKISPNIRVMLLPNDTPLLLPMPELEDSATETISSTLGMTSTTPSFMGPTLTPAETVIPSTQ